MKSSLLLTDCSPLIFAFALSIAFWNRSKAIGGGKDNGRDRDAGLGKVQAVEVGHVDIEQQDIDLVVLDQVKGFEGIGGSTYHIHVFHCLQIAQQQFASQEFIIYNQYVVFHNFLKGSYLPLTP